MDRETSEGQRPAAYTNLRVNQNVTSAAGPASRDIYRDQQVATAPAQQPEQNQVPASQPEPPKNSKAGKIGLIIGIVIVVIAAIAIFMMIFGKKASGNNNNTSSGDPAAGPKTVANAFIDDLQQDDTASAYHLESADFQSLSDKQVELSDPSKYVPNVNTQMTGTATGIDKGQYVAEVAYKLDNGSKSLYVELTLEENDGVWQIDGFDSSYTLLVPSI